MRIRRTINLRFFAALFLVLVAITAGAHFLHAFQVRRNASAILDQANAARDDKNVDQELRYLGQYLRYNPEDNDVRVRYALLLASHPKATRADLDKALTRLEEALHRDPERYDVRRKIAELAMRLGRLESAVEQLKKLLDEISPQDAELEGLLGQCYEAKQEFALANESFAKA